jgi:selenide,water dikinase
MRTFPVHACSDVTGFGLLGHAFEMASGSDVTIIFDSRKLPVLPAAVQLAVDGNLTGGAARNRAFLKDKLGLDASIPPGLVEVAYDPQTSGGLLIALPAREAPELVKRLQSNGVPAATIVGHSTPFEKSWVKLA